MLLFPAIDLYKGKAVRLYKGNYNDMTIYSDNPVDVAVDFYNHGAKFIHIVDLEGAKTGGTPNYDTIIKIKNNTGLFCEVGGGIRNINIIEKYLSLGIDRVIIGTAAVKDREFLCSAVHEYKDKIAVGVDVRDGYVSINGWTENTNLELHAFCDYLQKIGVSTIICTDISKDGAMAGTNREMYKALISKFKMKIIASGGVSSIEDLIILKNMSMYGAILGKAYYTGDVDLNEALEVCE